MDLLEARQLELQTIVESEDSMATPMRRLRIGSGGATYAGAFANTTPSMAAILVCQSVLRAFRRPFLDHEYVLLQRLASSPAVKSIA